MQLLKLYKVFLQAIFHHFFYLGVSEIADSMSAPISPQSSNMSQSGICNMGGEDNDVLFQPFELDPVDYGYSIITFSPFIF